MAKRIVAKTGSFTNQQNEVKGEYAKLGVMLNNDNGEYILMDPCVNLAGSHLDYYFAADLGYYSAADYYHRQRLKS